MNANKEFLNLDQLAARQGQAIVKRLVKKVKATDAENTVTKALGVLQENGVYACFLYLLAKEKNGSVLVEEMLNLLEGLGYGWKKPAHHESPEEVLNFLTEKVTVQLEPLLLAKETLEKMLIYARYGAKARAKE